MEWAKRGGYSELLEIERNARRVFSLISYYNVKNILLQIQNVEMCYFFCCRF